MRKNKIQICERSVNFFRLWRALGVSFEKKIPACGGLGLSAIYFEKNFPACGGLGISPTLLIISKD